MVSMRRGVVTLVALCCITCAPQRGERQATSFDRLFRSAVARDVDELIAASSDASPVTRFVAVATLAELGSPHAAPALVERLGDADPRVRQAAAHGLGVARTGARRELSKSLRDPSQEVRQAAAWALAQTGDLEDAMAELLNQERDPAKEIAARLFHSAMQSQVLLVHEQAYERLLLVSLGPPAPTAAAWAANDGREPVVTQLIGALGDESGLLTVRLVAAHTLGVLAAEEAVAPLLEAVQQSQAWPVRLKSLAVIGHLGNSAAVEPLVELLRTSTDLRLRSHLANTLGSLGDTRAVEPLLEVLVGPEYVAGLPVRPSMFDYQGREVWRQQTRDVQISAAHALGKLRDERAERVLQIFADPELRREVAAGRYPGKVVDLSDLAVTAAEQAHEEVIEAAREALTSIGAPSDSADTASNQGTPPPPSNPP
jgi:HEAT repeat protein